MSSFIIQYHIEPVYFEPENDALVFCNDEFLFNGSKINRMVGDVMVHGTFFVVGNTQNEYGEEISCSLTDEQIQKYSEMFEEPVHQLEMNDGVTIIIM